MKHYRALFVIPALFVALVLVGTPAQAKDEVDLTAKLPVDPALERVGQLDNGMGYWIRPHAVPKGKVTLMLHISSGSLQEEDNQRGLAHFLEHMAFNGSKHFPPGEVVKFFESMGMRFGQHQNAFTSFDQTTYILSLPDTSKETLGKGLLFFSDVADELMIAKEEVEKERGVIAEEKRSRSGAQMRILEKLFPMLMPGSRISERMPIGTDEVIQNAPPERLRAYYEKWYRPDISTLLVVGDIKAADVEPLVKETFSSWKKPETPAEVVDTGIRTFEGINAGVVTDPEHNNADVTINIIRDDQPMATLADYRRSALERMAVSMLNRRLRQRVQENEAAYTSASAQGGQAIAGFEMMGVDSISEPEDWKKALHEVVAEVRRAQEHGFGAEELAQAKQSTMARLQQMAQGMSMAPAMAIGQILNQTLTRGRRPISPEQHIELMGALLPSVTAADLQQALRGMLRLDNVYLSGMFPDQEGVTPPTADEVKACYAAAMAQKVEQQADRTAVGAILDKAPRPGTVASRIEDKELGVTSLVLGNGVRVHIKPMEDVETVDISASFLGGRVEEVAANRGITSAAGVAISPGRMATDRLKPADITQFLASRKVSVGGGVGDTSVVLEVSGAAEDLRDGMELAWLLMTEPKVDEASLENWKKGQKRSLDERVSNTQAQGIIGLRRLASGNDHRFTPVTAERIDAITCAEAQAWLDRVLRDAPVEVTIVGNIDVAKAERIATDWFGALAKRPDRWKEIYDLRKVNAVEGPVLATIPVKTVTPMAIVILGWRGVGLAESNERVALRHASAMLSSRLIKSVREERGLTYSVGAQYMTTGYDGLDGFGVFFTADPAKAVEAAQVAKDTVTAFAETGPNEAEIQAVEAQFKNIIGTQMQQNGFWSGSLGSMHADGRTLADLRDSIQRITQVDGEMIATLLKQVLADDRFARVIATPESPESRARAVAERLKPAFDKAQEVNAGGDQSKAVEVLSSIEGHEGNWKGASSKSSTTLDLDEIVATELESKPANVYRFPDLDMVIYEMPTDADIVMQGASFPAGWIAYRLVGAKKQDSDEERHLVSWFTVHVKSLGDLVFGE